MDLDAALLGGARVAPQERPGKNDRVGRVVAGGREAAGGVHVQLGDDRLRLGGRDHPRGHAAAVLDLDVAGQRFRYRVGAGEEQVAAPAHPDVHPHLFGEVGADLHRLLHEANVHLRRPLLAHAAAVAPRRPPGEIVAVDDHDPLAPPRRQVVGDGEAHDPRPHDRDLGVVHGSL
jgi:hypothetical protein